MVYVNGQLSSSSRTLSTGSSLLSVREEIYLRSFVYLRVPQGSILCPLFFVLFINDLPLYVNSGNIQIDLYADDTTLSSVF